MAGLVVRAAPSWNRQLGIGSHVALVVTVNDGTGAPITGLQASNFHVFDAGGHSGIEFTHAITPLAHFNEHASGEAPGAYTLGLGGGWAGDPVIIVDVTRGADRGRAMTQVHF